MLPAQAGKSKQRNTSSPDGANQRIQQGYGSNTRIIQKNTVTTFNGGVTVLHYYKQGSGFENIPSYN